MPWTVKDVDKHKKGLTPAQKKKWVDIANRRLKACGRGQGCEASAIKIANAAFSEDHEFDLDYDEQGLLLLAMEEWPEKDFEEYFQDNKAEARKKAGGSNVGKYKKGPFCGPSGGAPAGSYPVNTRARAIAAIAYARHAPNPSGIKKCVCRHYGDLPACKKKTKQSEMSLPELAFVLQDTECFAQASVGADGKPDRLNMKIYSGKTISKHWYWNNLAIDLDGLKFDQKRYPVLEDHMTERKIAFSKKPPKTDDGLYFDPDDIVFVDTEESLKFRDLSKQGFPFQASLRATPTVIERVEDGSSVEVNGMKLKGPGTVWREALFKEASVCVFGYDRNTSSTVFKDGQTTVQVQELSNDFYSDESGKNLEKGGGAEMTLTLDQLKSEHPDLVSALTDEAKAEAKAETEATLNEKIKSLEEENSKLKEQKSELTDRVTKLEKNDIIRSENELARHADDIFREKLSESDIPDDLHGKVMAMVPHRRFVKEGKFDEKTFTEAVQAEIADWEGRGVKQSVLGFSTSARTSEDSDKQKREKEAQEDDAAVEDMLASVGQKKET